MNSPAIYIVEDDAPIRDSIRLFLEILHYAVFTFASADEALAAYSADWKGCMVIDVRLPGMNGLDLIDALFQKGCRLPTIVMTGHTDGDSLRPSTEANVVAILEKPVAPETLKEVIQRVM